MKNKYTPEFHTGAPVDPIDLRFRGAFLEQLWQTLDNGHVVLTAPRRTGKTSVMDHLRHRPERGFSVVSINVQDLTHPADFFQALLDALHDSYPDYVRDQLARGWALLEGLLGKIDEIGLGGFKLALRRSDPDWRENWRRHGDAFLEQARKTGTRLLFIVDEFPDMLLNLARENAPLLREFLAWFRVQRQNPTPGEDSLRWMVGGSVNLASTLDALGIVDLINDFEDLPLPTLSRCDMDAFVTDMLSGRGVRFDKDVAKQLIARLGHPIPLFMQMATQDLYRLWKSEKRKLVATDVDAVFDAMIVSSGARTRLQHFYSRIRQYYETPNDSIACALLGKISASEKGLSRASLLQEAERLLSDHGGGVPAHERRQRFNRIMLDLENDFYIVEARAGIYDFACGVLKLWWRKYHA